MPGPDRRPALDAESFRRLRDLIYEHCGLFLREEMKFVLERRLWPRVEALGLPDYAAYHHFLRYDRDRHAELEAAVELLTTHETYFFREPHQLQAFKDELVPMLRARLAHTKRLRIWSAGCSTGEEPYTIAMLLREAGGFEDWDVQILGTDISRRVLAVARAGEYGTSSLRATSAEAQARFFDEVNGRHRVRPQVKEWVSFGQLNLVDVEAGKLLPRMDVIFCRNVMIYFDLPARRRVLQLLYDRLVPGGYLLLGHSENLISLTADFELVHLKTDLVYRRPEVEASAP